jgi:thiosulfate/3-mercaptopyruvate sulfurtransferase
MSGLELPGIVVEPDFLRAHLDEIVVCDVRWYLDGRDGRDAFRSGHIKGARFVDLDDDLSDPPDGERGRHPFPSAESFAQRLGALGIGDDDIVVAYDDLGGGTAGRLVWMLRLVGQDAALLNGGLRAWQDPLESGDPRSAEPKVRAVRPWPPSVGVSADELGALGPDERLLDARSKDRYDGRVEPTGAPAGHIPGARSMPYLDLLDEHGRYRDRLSLQSVFAERGVDETTPVIASCGSGVSACAVLIGLEHAGLGTGRLFVPSWSGWTAAGRPVEVTPAD